MKIEIIKEFSGMAVGTVKTIPDVYAKELIESGLAKSLDEKKTNKKVQEPKED